MAEKAGLIERIVLRDISIIIPARHDDAALARLLALLPSLVDFDASVQLLIAAAPATESMRALARAYNAELVESEPGRGVQMNAAAAKANSKTLWFLHADAEPHARSLVAIRAALDEGAEGGYFSFTFSGLKMTLVADSRRLSTGARTGASPMAIRACSLMLRFFTMSAALQPRLCSRKSRWSKR